MRGERVFQAILQNSRYRALRREDIVLNTRLSHFEKVLVELENNVDEPRDMQWAASQLTIFLDGVTALGRDGWQGLQDLRTRIQAGFVSLLGIAATWQQPQPKPQEKLTDYQRMIVPFLINDIVTGGLNGMSYHACSMQLREEKEVLLAMIPAFSMLPGMIFFGKKPQVVSTDKMLEAFELQKKKVDGLEKELQAACTEALGKVKAALNEPKRGEQLSQTQKARFEALEIEICEKQAAGKVKASEATKVAHYLTMLRKSTGDDQVGHELEL